MFRKEACTLSREQIEEKARELLEQMTLKEKVWMLNGNWDIFGNVEKYQNGYNPVPIETNGCPRLGISSIRFTDGPRGVVMGHSTCFPVSMARGASFDPDLEKRIGDVIGKEARCPGSQLFRRRLYQPASSSSLGAFSGNLWRGPLPSGRDGQGAHRGGAVTQCDRLRQALCRQQYRELPFLGERQS
ncbi:MAG: hypothetical protein IPK19_17130 [Chloroflexi bacterium]|nr:hypothetical protein [Chloroflexota bacterium]